MPDKGPIIFQAAMPTLMLGGVFLAAAAAPFGVGVQTAALLIPYALSIALTIIFPYLAEIFANKRRVIVSRFKSTINVMPKEPIECWLQYDPMEDPDLTFSPGYFEHSRRIFGYSQVPIKLRDPIKLMFMGKEQTFWMFYVRFKGEWTTRMTHKGCTVDYLGAYGLTHFTGDDVVFEELRPRFHPDVPVKHTNGDLFPVFRLAQAPGDLSAREKEEEKMFNEFNIKVQAGRNQQSSSNQNSENRCKVCGAPLNKKEDGSYSPCIFKHEAIPA